MNYIRSDIEKIDDNYIIVYDTSDEFEYYISELNLRDRAIAKQFNGLAINISTGTIDYLILGYNPDDSLVYEVIG